MGNANPTPDGGKKKKGKGKIKESTQNVEDVEVNEESTPFMVLFVIFEMKSGSTTKPEEMEVNPNTNLGDFKRDLKQLRGIRTSVAVRRDNRNDDLGPDNLSLSTLQLKNEDVVLYRECE